MSGVVVKDLEWVGDKADTPFGKYRVRQTDDGYALDFGYEELAHIGFNAVQGFESARTVALERAQPDFEARILSVINPTSPTDLGEVTAALDDMDKVAEWISRELPIPTPKATTMLIKISAAIKALRAALSPVPTAEKGEVPWPGRKFCETAGRNAAELAKWIKGDDDKTVARDAALAIETLLKALATSPTQPVQEPAYTPKIIEYDGEGEPYAEFVSADVPTVTRTGLAGELLLSLNRREIIGLRVFTRSESLSMERNKALEEAKDAFEMAAQESSEVIISLTQRIAELGAALEPIARGTIDVSGTAIILDSVESASKALGVVRSALKGDQQ